MYSHPRFAPAFRQVSICGRTCTLIMLSFEHALLQLGGQNLCAVSLHQGKLPESSASSMHRAVSTYVESDGKWNFMGGDIEESVSTPEDVVRHGEPQYMRFIYSSGGRLHYFRHEHPLPKKFCKFQLLDATYAQDLFNLACSTHPEQRFAWLIDTSGNPPQLHS